MSSGGMVGIATSYYVYRETEKILSTFAEEEDDIEQGIRQNGQGTSPWTRPSGEERRGFLEEEGSLGNQQYTRRSNSFLWDAAIDEGGTTPH
jgi:hypothetical protein